MFYNFIGIAYIIKQIENGYNDNIVELIKTVSDLDLKIEKNSIIYFQKIKILVKYL